MGEWGGVVVWEVCVRACERMCACVCVCVRGDGGEGGVKYKKTAYCKDL